MSNCFNKVSFSATIAASPMIYPVPLVAGDNRTAQVFGIAARGA